MEVNPEKQNIHTLFSTTNYHIDFYQREYKWKDKTVLQLINDIFYHFEQSYAEHPDLDPSEGSVTKNYSWYYLNTYITNKSGNKMYVVDGQQRLTTLTLMLNALYHMCSPDQFDSEDLREWVKAKILGVGSGGKKQFWMAHDRREHIMKSLFESPDALSEIVANGVTERHMLNNYKLIQKELSKRLPSRHKIDTFIYYFLGMVVIINLDVESTDVPMVFEVINDRGVRLQPHEILKGKMLGVIDKDEVDPYADIWEESLRNLEDLGDGEVDTFFRTYLRAHFSETRQQGQTFDGPYHRAIYEPVCEKKLHLNKNSHGVKDFLKGPFQYYARLFLKLKQLVTDEASTFAECYYSSELNRMDGYIMLTLAACSVDDPHENEKIAIVSKAFDRAYVMLQLNRAYDSNQFQEFLYKLHSQLIGCQLEDIEERINKQLLNEIKERRNATTESLISYNQFKQVGYGDYNTRFLRYFLTRIEIFISDGLGKQYQDSLYNFVSGTGKSNAYHIEHILSRNDESRALFTDDNGEHDEALFENERNRFGALLLLKGQDNSSSGNEIYKNKLRTYTGSAPYLAQTLVEDFYKSNAAMKNLIQLSGLDFKHANSFTRETLEERSLLLYKIICQIWDV